MFKQIDLIRSELTRIKDRHHYYNEPCSHLDSVESVLEFLEDLPGYVENEVEKGIEKSLDDKDAEISALQSEYDRLERKLSEESTEKYNLTNKVEDLKNEIAIMKGNKS